MSISYLGWDDFFNFQLKEYILKNGSKVIPARITAEFAGCYGAMCENGYVLVKLSGKIKYKSDSAIDIPVVGDWVLIKDDESTDRFPILTLLKRKSLLSRKAVGKQYALQPIAANADYVFIVQSLDENFNINRLDRYLTAVKSSKVNPVIILNKSDLCSDIDVKKSAAHKAAGDIPVYILNSINKSGYECFDKYLLSGKTLAFIGSSGVGKSTIINNLGADIQKTSPVKLKDSKGMHTTTTRRLLPLKNSALLIDTPGMKEFSAWEAAEGFKQNFTDIENLALQCKFGNCHHSTEPGCAVQTAIRNNILTKERLDNYFKLKAELKKINTKHY